MGGVKFMAPREWNPVWSPYPNSGGGVRISIKYILSPHYEKRHPPKVPLLAVEIEIHPLGWGLQAYLPPPQKKGYKKSQAYII